MVHFVEELDLCTSIHIQWMYCIKCMNKFFKGYVQCMGWLEGCMVESYAMEKSIGLLMEYMQNYTTVSQRVCNVEEEKGVSG